MSRALVTLLLIAVAPFVLVGENTAHRDPLAILRSWDAFPVHARPRPLVLLTGLPMVEKSRKVVTRVRLATDLPRGARMTAEVALPDGAVTSPLTSATEAYGALSSHMDGRPAPAQVGAVIGAEGVVRAFPSDRGLVSLPAWRFALAEGGALIWPALPARFFWRLGEVGPSSAIVKAAASTGSPDVTLWMGAGRSCGSAPDVRPEISISESGTAVVIRRIAHSARDRGDCIEAAYLDARPYVYRLNRPLGDRGLLDDSGNVVVAGERAAGRPRGRRQAVGAGGRLWVWK
ncbi:hypothetical protein MF672_019185 [Actinomadura sp. ATCC 31491]|uniref:Phosphodiester glycosidase domain-containing protein n=1 Tax=Actinomadura luzonensis TaxID=2805427 RepID=A0ABT0FUA7_9ACTN|nr:hypothetical protein [Actinomadura luzonensis]MCK2215904.1 hypothetical protein [Actinomadura luzonensis]